MGWASTLPTAVIALAIAGPAVAETGDRSLKVVAPRFDPAATPTWVVARDEPGFRPSEFRFAVSDTVDLFMKGGKTKPVGESSGRRADRSVGPAPKAVKVGVQIRW